MKKLFVCAAIGVLAVACSSASKNNNTAANGTAGQYSKYQILDQEFDNVAVVNDGYDRVAPYEDQINGSTYIQSKTSQKGSKKPNRTMTGQKVVVDGQGNILSSDATAPVMDEEHLPN